MSDGQEPPGPLIGTGRSADVYALGASRVLRRFRTPYDVTGEAAVMRHLEAAGYPVPHVYEASGADLVLERLDGRDMLTDMGARPWLIPVHARTLADLHNRLHEIAAPPGMPQWPGLAGPGAAGPGAAEAGVAGPGLAGASRAGASRAGASRAGASRAGASRAGAGDRVLHVDLHPGNVLLTGRGPVVIDWTNALAGPPGADVAIAYAIMATADTDLIPPLIRTVLRPLRATFLRVFLAAVRDDHRPYLAAAARARIADRNTRPSEVPRLERLAQLAEARR